MKDTELRQCPFCGQYIMTGEGRDTRELCSCDGAKKYQTRLGIYNKRLNELRGLCGEDMEDGIFKAVSEEAYGVLEKVLYSVVFHHIGKTRTELCDGSVLAISEKSVERKITFSKRIG